MAKVIVSSDDDGNVYLKIANAGQEFHAIVRMIKESVPFYKRTFLAESKIWRFPPESKEDISLLLANLDALAELEIQTTYELEDPHAVLCVVRTAPYEVVQAAYKALAKKHHPDAGGNTEMMKRLNSAFDTIKRLRNVSVR